MTTLQYEDSGYRKKQEQEERDNFAIDFANWLVLYYTEKIFYEERYTEKLLEIYKKEKGL